MKINFSGTISSEVEQDVRPLYFSEALSITLLNYVTFVGTTAFIVCYWLNVDLWDSIQFHEIRPVQGTYALPIRLLLVLPILITFYLAVLRLPHWWRWWWKRVKSTDWSGAVGEEGVYVKAIDDSEPLMAWKLFEEARLGSNAVFLPIGRADGVVFHQTFFRDLADWDRFIDIVKSSGLRIRSIRPSA